MIRCREVESAVAPAGKGAAADEDRRVYKSMPPLGAMGGVTTWQGRLGMQNVMGSGLCLGGSQTKRVRER